MLNDDRHGTMHSFWRGCRCEPCRLARRTYNREHYRRHAAARGVSLVDAAQVQRHLKRLLSQGMGERSIADGAGVDRKTVHRVAAGLQVRLTRRTAFRLLRVSIDHAADHVLIDAAPTWALLEQLIDEGYTRKALAKLLGYRGKNVPIGKARCSVRNANRVRVLHEALTGDIARPIPRTRPHYHARRVYMPEHVSGP